MKILKILILVHLIVINCVSLETLLVNTSVGQICGVKMKNFTSFLGIPYGVVNHTNPFAPAEPYPVFKDTYQAFEKPEVCAQMYRGVPIGTLDCLKLNVYMSNDNVKKSLPVMVFIHGGLFFEGHGNMELYSPTFLVQHDVILVTMHYRLGPYGCLCLKQTQYYNGQGVNDQRLALQWVRDNINGFGGDPNNVLIFGHSSGSITVNYHMIYNNDLFNKAIMQSGVLISPVNYADSELGFEMAKKLEMKLDNNGNVDDFIRNLSNFKTYDLIKIANEINSRRICLKDVEKESLRNLKTIKVLIGNTNKESGFPYACAKDDFFEKFDFKTALERGFFNVTEEMLNEIKDFYCKTELKEDIIDFVSDLFYIYPVERTIKLLLEHDATVYRYFFTFDGNRNAMKVNLGVNYTRAIHADELGYLFDMDLLMNLTTSRDTYMIDKLTRVWTDFAKYGYPLNRQTGSPYPATDMINKPFIQLDLPVRISYLPFKSRMDFWDIFYKTYGKISKGLDYFNSISAESKAYTNSATRNYVISYFSVCIIFSFCQPIIIF